jgi:hypothetical protein
VKTGYNNSSVALPIVKGDERGTRRLGVKLGHPVIGGYKYGDLFREVGVLTQGQRIYSVKNSLLRNSKK